MRCVTKCVSFSVYLILKGKEKKTFHLSSSLPYLTTVPYSRDFYCPQDFWFSPPSDQKCTVMKYQTISCPVLVIFGVPWILSTTFFKELVSCLPVSLRRTNFTCFVYPFLRGNLPFFFFKTDVVRFFGVFSILFLSKLCTIQSLRTLTCLHRLKLGEVYSWGLDFFLFLAFQKY